MVFVGKKIYLVKCFDTVQALEGKYQVVAQDHDYLYIQAVSRLHTGKITKIPITNRTFYFDDSIYQWDDQSETLQEVKSIAEQYLFMDDLVPNKDNCDHFINKDIIHNYAKAQICFKCRNINMCMSDLSTQPNNDSSCDYFK